MELFIFARFHARAGIDEKIAAVRRDKLPPVRAGAPCLGTEVFRGARDRHLLLMDSRWLDAAAFDHHAQLSRARTVLARVEPLIDDPLDVVRTGVLPQT